MTADNNMFEPLSPEEQSNALSELRNAPAWNKPKRISVVQDEMSKECISCCLRKPFASFHSCEKNGRTYASSACKECVAIRYTQYKNTWRGKVASLLSGMRHSAKSRDGKRLRDGTKRQMPPSEATMTHWANKLEESSFRCWMTMVLPHGGLRLDPRTTSPERLDNTLTYIETNWYPVHIAFQSMQASWTRSKVLAVSFLRMEPTDLGEQLQNSFVWHRYATAVDHVEGGGIYGYHLETPDVRTFFLNQYAAAEHIQANRAHVSKVCNGLRPHTMGWCFQYVKGSPPTRPLPVVPPLYTKARNMANCAKKDTVIRNHRRSKDGRRILCASTITTVDILEIFEAQEGRCKYLNIPLRLNGDWMMSLERIDDDIGYARENSVLVVGEVNSGFWKWSKEFADAVWLRVRKTSFWSDKINETDR